MRILADRLATHAEAKAAGVVDLNPTPRHAEPPTQR